MRIRKIPMDGFDAVLYKTKKFSTIHISLLFEMEYTKENIAIGSILGEYLFNTNSKYKTKKEIHEASRDLYGSRMSISNYNCGKKMFTQINLSFVDPFLVKDDYIEKVFEFFRTCLYEPRFENGQLDAETLNKIKTNVLGVIASNLEEPESKAIKGLYENIFPNSYMTEHFFYSKEEVDKFINSFKDEDYINFYHNLLDKSFIGMTIMGNVNDKILNCIKNTFKFKIVNSYDYNYEDRLSINDKNNFIKVTDENQTESIVFALYECENYNLKKRYIYSLIEMMLSKDGKLFHKVIRDELHIAYSIGVTLNERCGYFIFDAHIAKENLELCLQGFDAALEKLLIDDELLENLLHHAKEQVNYLDYISDENKSNVLSDLFIEAYKTIEPRKKQNKIKNSVTKVDIRNELVNLKRKVVYFYEGIKEHE